MNWAFEVKLNLNVLKLQEPKLQEPKLPLDDVEVEDRKYMYHGRLRKEMQYSRICINSLLEAIYLEKEYVRNLFQQIQFVRNDRGRT